MFLKSHIFPGKLWIYERVKITLLKINQCITFQVCYKIINECTFKNYETEESESHLCFSVFNI